MQHHGSTRVVDLGSPKLVTPEHAHRMRSRVVVLGPGKETGAHVTSSREELLVPLEGDATLVGPEGEQTISPGQAVYIPEGMEHNVVNRSDSSIRYIYVLALHDDYGRIKGPTHSH